MKTLRSLLFIFPLLSTLVTNISASGLCDLCEGGVAGLYQSDYFVDAHGTTCVTKALEMAADFRIGSSTCNAEIRKHRRCCCSQRPVCSPINQVSTRPPVYNGPRGQYPDCDICKGRGRPTNTAMVVNMLYVGTATCPQMYDYGRNGLIQRHMCDPLQHYAYEPCGCGEFGGTSNQAPGNTGGGSNNGGGNNGGGNNGGGNNNSGGDLSIRKTPQGDFNKNNLKYGRQGRGGSANGGRRVLKGNKE